jgi:hypothetical protein
MAKKARGAASDPLLSAIRDSPETRFAAALADERPAGSGGEDLRRSRRETALGGGARRAGERG